jgi:hypothetical protein
MAVQFKELDATAATRLSPDRAFSTSAVYPDIERVTKTFYDKSSKSSNTNLNA